jgi:predicted permease
VSVEVERRVYRTLLRALPGRFRRRFGADMEEVFALRRGEARGLARGAWVWTRALTDLVAIALRERAAGITTIATTASLDRGGGGMGSLLPDLRQAARALANAPVLAATVIVTLALGIGASTATFSVVHAVLLASLPYAEPERLVVLWPERNFNTAMVRELLASSPALESATGISGWTFTFTGEGEPLEVEGARVSPAHFRVLGVEPMLGRTFTDHEGIPGNEDVAILSHGFWVRTFGADPAVLGRRIQLATNDHATRTVVGVMPPDFRPVVSAPQVWVPLSVHPTTPMVEDDTWYVNHRVARLAPGASVEEAGAQVRAFAQRALEAMPRIIDEDDVRVAGVRPLHRHAAGSMGPVLWVALGAVSLVLLIACVNVANLLLARGVAREHDLAVRAALGAGRERVARALLTESGLLGVLGGALGVVLSYGLVRVIVGLAPADFPRIGEVGLDGAVLLWAVAATVASTLLAGLLPAVRTSRVDPAVTLGGSSRAASGRRGSRLTPFLVGAEVALAVVVVVGSGLMLRSLERVTAEDPGLEAAGVLVFRASPPSGRYPDAPSVEAFYRQVLERVSGLPEVERASAIHLLPGTGSNWMFPTEPEGYEIGNAPVPSVNYRMVYPGYFETVGTSLVQGRFLGPGDDREAQAVAVVNQAFVDRFWPGVAPVGRTLAVPLAGEGPFRVVGVVADVRQHGLASEPRPEMYFTHAQVGSTASFWIVARMRPGIDPPTQAATVQNAVWSVDPGVPLSGMDELSHVFGASVATTRFLAAVLGAFGTLALVLGAVGVFGVTAFTVGSRRSEFGVRIALGASRGEVLRSALSMSMLPVGAGLAVGLLVASTSSDALATALYEIEPTDPLTFGVVALTLMLVASGAALLPAWRASRLDPVEVLNQE